MQGQLLFGTETSAAPMPKKTAKPKKTRTHKVSRGKNLKRHPSRPPVIKRVVKSKPVAMKGHEGGPIGNIVDRDGDTLFIVWPGKGDKVYMHNARYMVSVDKE